MAFPEKLKALRLKNGLTQDELGEKLYLSRTSISNYEIGKNEPNIETIIAISDLFNITTDELLRGGVNTMTNFEKIKQMSIDEMARSSIDFFSCPYNIPGDPQYSYCDCKIGEKFNHNCINCTKHWLESEVEE